MTGAAGFIGTHLVESLVSSGANVIGIDDQRTGDWSRLRASCTRLDRDLTTFSEAEFRSLVQDADLVFHLAAEKYNSSKATPQSVIDTNVTASHRLFTAAAKEHAKVVFTSSLYAYGAVGPEPMSELDVLEPDTVYGASKATGEYLLRSAGRDHGLEWAVARLFFVYGPRQFAEGGYKSVIVKNFERLQSGLAPVIVGDGEQQLDYVFIDDVVSALHQLGEARHNGLVVNIGTGCGISINEITEKMTTIANYRQLPESAPPDWTAGSRRVADTTRARHHLHWAPQRLEDGLRQVWEGLGG
ncbi:NAD-dependent epimerase/dehydratase family protein [Gemmatimonas sp.]|uniref:NAD-dependent epimerase/dehydratase family protein n=1 Tax=Gemmatimonas sp. TaxID=1962908 RepID=UPI003561C864